MAKRKTAWDDADLTPYQMSAIIGLWRMGNVNAVIAAVIGCEGWQVVHTVITYQYSIKKY